MQLRFFLPCSQMGRLKNGEMAEGKRSANRSYKKRVPRARCVAFPPSTRKPWGAYSSLGVKFGASQQEIRSAWKRLILLYHTDKLPANASCQQKGAATKKFREVQAAYELLSDVGAKTDYDQCYWGISSSTVRSREHRARLTKYEKRVVSSMNYMRRVLQKRGYKRALRKSAKRGPARHRTGQGRIVTGSGAKLRVRKVCSRKTPNCNNKTVVGTRTLVVCEVEKRGDRRRNGVACRPDHHVIV